jgi:anhydro-N-acetylmuramic acid kinase
LTLEHAGAVRRALGEAGLSVEEEGGVALVADHGQTVFHAPPVTMQLLDPALLATELRIAVVSDFRRADCALGGQGAPLVPFADRILFQDEVKTRALLNLGGIANLTLLPGGGKGVSVAFDVGPANCLSDHLCRVHDPRGPGFDRGGHLARKGRANEAVIAAFLRHAYFRGSAPKSTDGPAMIAAFEQAGGMRLGYHEALATAAECVARAIADAVQVLHPMPEELIMSGGGTHNLAVTSSLTRLLPETHLLTTDQLGVPGAAKEAMAFALLGAAWLDGVAGNVPSCTGARREALLGSLTLPG